MTSRTVITKRSFRIKLMSSGWLEGELGSALKAFGVDTTTTRYLEAKLRRGNAKFHSLFWQQRYRRKEGDALPRHVLGKRAHHRGSALEHGLAAHVIAVVCPTIVVEQRLGPLRSEVRW